MRNTLVEKFEHDGLTIEIHYDEDCESPRTSQTTLSRMVLAHRRYNLPHELDTPDEIDSGKELHDYLVETYKPLVILPVWGYDHGSLHLKAGSRVGSYSDPWDSGLAGFVLVLQEQVDETGAPLDSLEKQAQDEVEEYDTWANGGAYGYIIKGADGEEVPDGSCWGIVGLEWAEQEAKMEATADAQWMHQQLDDSRDWREAVTLAKAIGTP